MIVGEQGGENRTQESGIVSMVASDMYRGQTRLAAILSLSTLRTAVCRNPPEASCHCRLTVELVLLGGIISITTRTTCIVAGLTNEEVYTSVGRRLSIGPKSAFMICFERLCMSLIIFMYVVANCV